MRPGARTIQPLSDLLINQIAAGEVIERPASVVKELVENSLDAGALRIDVEVEQGGLAAITVTDDGSGIPAAEIHAALERHWTSKLGDARELESIASLGFRGEALASIAAVADLEITSRTADDDHAWRVTASAGRAASRPVPCSGAVGTRVVVRDLFHNVPARRRFLKRARTEYLHVQRLLRHIGFAAPAVALGLSQPGTRGLRLRPAADGRDARWKTLFGETFCARATCVEASVDGIVVRGWVGGPDLASNQSEHQYLALNGRHIRDRQLAHAVRLAYEERLPAGRYPAYALAIEVPPAAVDVNVHPGKLEVRFASARAVHDLVYTVVRRGLGDAEPPQAAPATAPGETRAGESAVRYDVATGAASAPASLAFGRPLALVEQRYVVFVEGGVLYGLDLRAAWREALFTRLAAAEGAAPATRPLLFPHRLGNDGGGLDDAACEALAARGVGIELIGDGRRVLRSVPALLPDIVPEIFAERLAANLRAAEPPSAAIATAAADAVTLGEHGLPAGAMLRDLARAREAAGIDAKRSVFRIDAAALARLADAGR